jgi:hypothetical protein
VTFDRGRHAGPWRRRTQPGHAAGTPIPPRPQHPPCSGANDADSHPRRPGLPPPLTTSSANNPINPDQHLHTRFWQIVRPGALGWSTIRLVDYEQGCDLDGYVWGVKWHLLYPEMKLVPDSVDAKRWSRELGRPFYEAVIETNGHNLALVFSDLVVDRIATGHAPFVVPGGGPDFKIPLPK